MFCLILHTLPPLQELPIVVGSLQFSVLPRGFGHIWPIFGVHTRHSHHFLQKNAENYSLGRDFLKNSKNYSFEKIIIVLIEIPVNFSNNYSLELNLIQIIILGRFLL